MNKRNTATPKNSVSNFKRKTWTLLSSTIVMLALQLMPGKASAFVTELSPNSLTTTASNTAPTTLCGLNGTLANTWLPTLTKYWTYDVTTTGYYKLHLVVNTTSSATGPHVGYVYYNVNSTGWVSLTSYSWSGTGCYRDTITLPAACENKADVQVKLLMDGATGTAGTNRVGTSKVFFSDSGACTTVTAGSISPASSSFCGSTSTLLTLTGATSGGGITYQWQASSTGLPGSWSNVGTGANTYGTPLLTPGTYYYRNFTVCGGSGASDTTAAVTVTINNVPAVAAISSTPAFPTPIVVGVSTATLTDATVGGLWSSSDPSIATVAGGIVTPVAGGTVKIKYTVVDGVTGCTNSASTYVDAAWPNTLALYNGGLDYDGSGNHVVVKGNATVSKLDTIGFGPLGTQCSSGGMSGLTIPVTDTAFDVTKAHIFYTIKPTAGNALTIYRIKASTRESSNGPRSARIAYYYQGAWHDEGRNVFQSTGGSCGAASNTWDFNGTGGGPTINGIKDSIIVAVFPYNPSTSDGTFQLNDLEVYGLTTSSANCSGTPSPAGVVTPLSPIYICDSGSRWLSLDSGSFTGAAGPGISYQWQRASMLTPTTFVNISGANGVSNNTGKLHADSTWIYRVVTTCSFSGLSSTSTRDTVIVKRSPVAPTGITGITNGQYVNFGDAITIAPSTTTAGHTYLWSSNDTSAVSVGRIGGTGGATTLNAQSLPGIATITLIDSIPGCYTVGPKYTVNNIAPYTLLAYLGTNGTSTSTVAFGVTGSSLFQTGYGSNGHCSTGGLSGLTNDGVYAYNPTGAHTYVSLTPTAGNIVVFGNYYATLRMSNSGLQNATLAYRTTGAASYTDDAIVQDVDMDGCGYSHTLLTFNDAIPNLTGANADTFAVFGYNPAAANGTLQVNALDVTGCVYGGPIMDVTHTRVLDGGNYGNACSINISGLPTAGGSFNVSGDAFGYVTLTPTGAGTATISFSGITAGNPEDPTIEYTVGSCPFPLTATIHLSTSYTHCNGVNKTTGVANVNNASGINIYPNPASTVLNIVATEQVNVVIMSVDGKILIDQKDAKNINVSKLTSGLYIVQVYNADNTLIKTTKFTKN